MGLQCLLCGGHSCPPFLPQWEEQGSCLPAWSSTPASLDIFLLVAVFFLSRHHFLRVPSATFLLHWSIKTLMVSPEQAHRESRVKKACFLHLGLPFLWFLQCPEPISPHAPPQEPGWLNPPHLQDLGSGWGDTAQLLGFPQPGSSRKSELDRERLTLGGGPVTKQDQSSGELVPWSAGDTH